MHPDLNDTILLVDRLHAGQTDKLGAPYYFHPMRVMMRLGPHASDADKHAALLHDVLEEDVPGGGVTETRLREYGYSDAILSMVCILTRPDGMSYPDYIDRIISSGHVGAMRIKLADLYDNTNAERVRGAPKEVRAKIFSLCEKRYRPSIAKLKLALGEQAETVISGDLH